MLRRASAAADPFDDSRLLLARIIKPEVAADLLEPVSREVCEDLGKVCLPRGDEGFEEPVLHPTVRHHDAEAIDGGKKLIAGKAGDNIAS